MQTSRSSGHAFETAAQCRLKEMYEHPEAVHATEANAKQELHFASDRIAAADGRGATLSPQLELAEFRIESEANYI
jgi:hypothetical protein